MDLRFNRVADNTIWLLENENSIMANSDLLSGLWDAVWNKGGECLECAGGGAPCQRACRMGQEDRHHSTDLQGRHSLPSPEHWV